jgi:hypothetical protein
MTDLDFLIRRAIADKRRIRFRLGDTVRVGEPHDYGIRNGAPQLLFYQTDGQSTSGPLPDWRWAVLSKMSALELLDDRFQGRRETVTGSHNRWDKLFARVPE